MNEEYINPIINNTQMKWNLTCYLSTQSQHKCATEEITIIEIPNLIFSLFMRQIYDLIYYTML